MNGVSQQIDLDAHLKQIISFPDTSSTEGTEGVDAILAPIFRDVLAHNAGREFTEQLETFTAEKVAEIERMCNSNHQEFVGAVDKLLKARQGASGLRRQSICVPSCFILTYSARFEQGYTAIRKCPYFSHAATLGESNHTSKYRRGDRDLTG